MLKPTLASILAVVAIAISLLLPVPASADPVSFDWGSFSSAGLTTFGVYDTNNTTVLQTGDLAQLLWAGPDGVIASPAPNGTPGGDDVLLDSSSVLNGSPLPPPLQNKGYIPLKTYTFDNTAPQNGGVVYIRAWNSNTVASATAYGNSQTAILNGGAIFNAPRWHTEAAFAVQFASFSAHPVAGSILVSWDTVSEIGNQGFNLYRGLSPTAPETLLAFVPSQAPGSSQGYSYEWLDQDVIAGQTYYYWLEALDLSGATTMVGPVSATVQGPTAVELTDLSAGPAGRPGFAWLAVPLALLLGAIYWLKRRIPA